MPAVYRLGSVLVLPSYGPDESWGLCVNEAMASGVPALVSDHVGCSLDLVQDQQTGWIFNSDEPGSLKQCMERILENTPQLEQIQIQARDQIAHYSYTAASAGLKSALNHLFPHDQPKAAH